MAVKKNSNNEVPKVSETAGDEEGFALVQSGNRLWWSPLVGEQLNPICGIPLNRVERPDQDGFQYVFRLTRPTLAKDSDGNVVEAPVGEIVYVDERAQLSSVNNFLLVDREAEVLIKPLGKGKTKEGRSVWKFNVGAKATGKKRAVAQLQGPAAPQLPAAEAHFEGEDDFGF